jgi:2-keto-4-pentenoate hydratase
MDKIQEAADFLADLRNRPREVDEIPGAFYPSNVDQAYEVQKALIKSLLSRLGGTRIGYKIACTNRLAQELLNIDTPFFGCLLSALTYAAPARPRADTFTHRLIEAEFAFEISADVPAPNVPYTRDSISEFVQAVMPSIEIVDWRYTDWTTVGAPSLIADNAIHGAWIHGAPCPRWRDFNLASHPVRLLVNGKVTQEGSGGAVLGHPLNVLAWLANELPLRGLSLKKGDRVSTGVTTNVYLAQAGDDIRADFGPLGTVDLIFD